MKKEPKQITIFHSPDADDAFMFYGMSVGAVDIPGFEFSHELCDIETLNHRALRGEVDVTAISLHAFPHLGSRYAILRCGASMGGVDYGPKLVSKSAVSISAESLRSIAIPGVLTSAALALKMYLRECRIEAELLNLPFDKVQDAVLAGDVDAGVIIHEGQLTHSREGLHCLVDLGEWWWKKENLPLPLGVNIVRKDLGEEAMHAVYKALKGSIEFSLAHRKEALNYALKFGRGITVAEADKFVGMYVNDLTVDLGEVGERAIRKFLGEGFSQGLISGTKEIEFVS